MSVPNLWAIFGSPNNQIAYLKAALEAIAAGHRQDRIDELLPWNFKLST